MVFAFFFFVFYFCFQKLTKHFSDALADLRFWLVVITCTETIFFNVRLLLFIQPVKTVASSGKDGQFAIPK